MANPPGMKPFHITVSETDAIHVYSKDDVIWLQMRRNVPTDADPKTQSFKTLLEINPWQAQELGLELLSVAHQFYKTRRAEQQAAKKEQAVNLKTPHPDPLPKGGEGRANVVPMKAGKI